MKRAKYDPTTHHQSCVQSVEGRTDWRARILQRLLPWSARAYSQTMIQCELWGWRGR